MRIGSLTLKRKRDKKTERLQKEREGLMRLSPFLSFVFSSSIVCLLFRKVGPALRAQLILATGNTVRGG